VTNINPVHHLQKLEAEPEEETGNHWHKEPAKEEFAPAVPYSFHRRDKNPQERPGSKRGNKEENEATGNKEKSENKDNHPGRND